MKRMAGYNEIELKNGKPVNDYIESEKEESNLFAVIGFVGFAALIYLAIIKISEETFLSTFVYAAENDGMPGLANPFGFVFGMFWFICSSLLLWGIVFKISRKFLKGF